ncbi:hypothetical protein ACIP5Z_01620 [Rothia terrae]|uniref:hypothetical protein n=1 Tax=Rothia terrae TaxID=396015 RepID=UPI0037F1AA70
MTTTFEQFRKDYPGIIDNPHIFNISTVYEYILMGEGEAQGFRSVPVAVVQFQRTGIREDVSATARMPHSEVPLFLYELHRWKNPVNINQAHGERWWEVDDEDRQEQVIFSAGVDAVYTWIKEEGELNGLSWDEEGITVPDTHDLYQRYKDATHE